MGNKDGGTRARLLGLALGPGQFGSKAVQPLSFGIRKIPWGWIIPPARCIVVAVYPVYIKTCGLDEDEIENACHYPNHNKHLNFFLSAPFPYPKDSLFDTYP